MDGLFDDAGRKCARCRVFKGVAEFGKYHKGPAGLNSYCRPCQRILNREAKARCRERKLVDPAYRAKIDATNRDLQRRHWAALCPLGKIVRNRAALSLEWVRSQYAKQGGRCYWSGLPMEASPGGSVRNPRGPSLDRIKPGGPYNPDNVVLACLAINRARGEMACDEFTGFLADLSASLANRPEPIKDG